MEESERITLNQKDTRLVYSPKDIRDRANPRVNQGDITRAVLWFEDIAGEEVKSIILNPQYKNLGDDKRIRFSTGCLAWEIWLSADVIEGKIRAFPSEPMKIPAEN